MARPVDTSTRAFKIPVIRVPSTTTMMRPFPFGPRDRVMAQTGASLRSLSPDYLRQTSICRVACQASPQPPVIIRRPASPRLDRVRRPEAQTRQINDSANERAEHEEDDHMSNGTSHFQFRSSQVCGRGGKGGRTANVAEGGVVTVIAKLAEIHTPKCTAANALSNLAARVATTRGINFRARCRLQRKPLRSDIACRNAARPCEADC